MNPKVLLTAATAALALAAAPSAFAQDYCVADASCVSGGGVDEPTVEAALTAADATFASDRVLIGPGQFVAPTTAGYGAKSFPVEIIGAGAGATTLTGPPDTDTVLYLNGVSSRVADVGIVVPATLTNATKYGLNLVGASGERLSISDDPTIATVTSGARVGGGGSLQGSKVELPQHGPLTVGVSLQQHSIARGADITARTGVAFQGSDTHAIRTRVHANWLGADVLNSATDIDLKDSLIQMTGNTTGVAVSTGNSPDAGIAVR